ncbi:hypothetical protein CC86DRAFT_464456 [Ophiobolus disseminans]|uniref:UBA domain-containing protein n=1 Tax=Ophiobolus disseminans TaxID=1469910 RepID=A0A6A7ABL4_9PLEO|nr:hypothetical protein CC86DRAFT_464456 [Ophiobolus disseminans]
MITPVSQIPGPDHPATTKLLPFQHFLLLQSANRTCSLDHSPYQKPESHRTRIERPSPKSKGDALDSTSKRRMYSLRDKSNKKSGTILRAVPGTTACATALLSEQRDTTAHVHQDVSTRAQIIPGSQSSSSPSCYEASKSRQHSRGASSSSPVKCSPVEESKPASNTSLKGAIGVYKHGKIQWRQRDHTRSDNGAKNRQSTDRDSRPKIQVVIPGAARERPLPAIPFFGTPGRNHIIAAWNQSGNAHDVSPPSASTKIIMRNSVVSPLNQTQPISFGQFQRSMSRVIRKTTVRTSKRPSHTAKPSGSSIDSHDSDSASTYSTRSSETSFGADSPPLDGKHTRHYSVQNPIAAGVFDSSPETYAKPPPSFPPRRYAHQPQDEQNNTIQPTCSLQRPRHAIGSLSRRPTLNRKSSKRPNRQRSLATDNGVIDGAISRSTSRQLSNPLRVASPTLSEAENDLEEHLTSLTEDANPAAFSSDRDGYGSASCTEASPFDWGDGLAQEKLHDFVSRLRQDSVDVDITITPPPAVPRKSSKRQSSANADGFRLSRVPGNHIASQIERGRSRGPSPKLTITIPEYTRNTTTETEVSAMATEPRQTKRSITATCAEGVILNIFRSLDHFDDLFATAVVNRGFYRVFKRHELELVKGTLRSMSSPAWEFREIAFPGHDQLHDEDLEMTRPQEEYSVSSYIHLQKRDVATIRAIKSLIKEKCQSFVRPEISIALISDDPIETARIDDALWRIWTFCKIFGSGKGREEDIVAQQDWLKGGILVHQQACTFSIMSTDYMNDTLVSAPECFAKGNEGGLTAEQLFDMMELWNCLGVLLQGLEGRTAQAREYGIYDNTEIGGGDIDGEEMMLDEWCYYLLTFGLSTVLELNSPCRQTTSAPFKVATQHGWNNWTPPVFGGSRRNFLKEAASRVYEDKIAHTYATTSTRDIQRELSKQRLQQHITELRERKTNGPRMPMISMSQERPMSEWSTVIGNLTRPRPPLSTESNIVSYIPTLRSALAQELTASIAELPASRTPEPSTRSSSPRRIVAQPLLPTPPPSTVPSTRDRSSIATMSMPSISEHPAYRSTTSPIPSVPSLADHPAFRHHHTPRSAPLPLEYHQAPRTHSRSSSSEYAAFQQHPTQHGIYASEAHENTAEKAIYRIVEMGFTPEQAREALRMTDLGDGLRVDRAVEMLLCRERGPERRGRISYV